MKKRKFADGGEIEDLVAPDRKVAIAKALAQANDPDAMGEGNPKFNMDEFTALREEKPPQDPFAKIPLESKAKPKVVTAEQLQAFKKQYGADKDLTDYMNAQQGLKRRRAATAMPNRAASDFQKSEKIPPKLKYQSLQDREKEYAAKLKDSGVGMYGTRNAASETRTPKRARNLTDMLGVSDRYAKGGSVSSRADGIAQRGKTRGKMR
jgi:hypothetical protein